MIKDFSDLDLGELILLTEKAEIEAWEEVLREKD